MTPDYAIISKWLSDGQTYIVGYTNDKSEFEEDTQDRIVRYVELSEEEVETFDDWCDDEKSETYIKVINNPIKYKMTKIITLERAF